MELANSAKRQSVNNSGFLGHTVAVTVIQLCCVSVTAAPDGMQANDCGCVSIKLYLQTPKFRFYKTFLCRKIVFFKNVVQPLKNVKAILSLRAIPK